METDGAERAGMISVYTESEGKDRECGSEVRQKE